MSAHRNPPSAKKKRAVAKALMEKKIIDLEQKVCMLQGIIAELSPVVASLPELEEQHSHSQALLFDLYADDEDDEVDDFEGFHTNGHGPSCIGADAAAGVSAFDGHEQVAVSCPALEPAAAYDGLEQVAIQDAASQTDFIDKPSTGYASRPHTDANFGVATILVPSAQDGGTRPAGGHAHQVPSAFVDRDSAAFSRHEQLAKSNDVDHEQLAAYQGLTANGHEQVAEFLLSHAALIEAKDASIAEVEIEQLAAFQGQTANGHELKMNWEIQTEFDGALQFTRSFSTTEVQTDVGEQLYISGTQTALSIPAHLPVLVKVVQEEPEQAEDLAPLFDEPLEQENLISQLWLPRRCHFATLPEGAGSKLGKAVAIPSIGQLRTQGLSKQSAFCTRTILQWPLQQLPVQHVIPMRFIQLAADIHLSFVNDNLRALRCSYTRNQMRILMDSLRMNVEKYLDNHWWADNPDLDAYQDLVFALHHAHSARTATTRQ